MLMFKTFTACCLTAASLLCFSSTTLSQEAAANPPPTAPKKVVKYYPSGGGGLLVGSEEFLKNYASLAGIEGIYVVLDYVFGSSEKNGITLRNDDLEDQVRLRLEEAGLKMLTKEEMEQTPGQPEMAVYPAYSGGTIGAEKNPLVTATTTTDACDLSCCRNSVWVSVSQSANLLRRPDSQYKLGTWGNGDDSNWCENRGDWMYDAVLGVIDSFIDDYQKAEKENEPLTISNAEEVPANCSQSWAVNIQIFDRDSTELKPEILPILNEFVEQAKRCASYDYIVETHADARATNEYNKLLTQVRASVLKDYLVTNQIAYNRVRTIAYGESAPVTNGETESDHAANRRVVIRPQLKTHTLAVIDE